MLLNSFNHFRAIAIMFIVAGHSYRVVGMQPNSLLDSSLLNIINGGTSLFVFISGFLFHHVYFRKYQYSSFVTTKVKNVLIAYLVIGFIPVMLLVASKAGYYGMFLPNGSGVINEYIIPAVKYYATGRFSSGYWYIPFIMLMFLLSPIHIKYISLRLRWQLIIIAATSVASVLGHRPVLDINVFQSVVYFTPIYLIGITASIHKEKIYQYLERKEMFLLLLVILFAGYQSYSGHAGNYHKSFFESGDIDLMFFQKIFLCAFFMIWLNRFEHHKNSLAQCVAFTSFAIYFIHPLIIAKLMKLNLAFLRLDSWWFLLLFVCVLMAVCSLIAISIKYVIPKYSQYITGY